MTAQLALRNPLVGSPLCRHARSTVQAKIRPGSVPKISVTRRPLAGLVTIWQAMKVTKWSTFTGGFEHERPEARAEQRRNKLPRCRARNLPCAGGPKRAGRGLGAGTRQRRFPKDRARPRGAQGRRAPCRGAQGGSHRATAHGQADDHVVRRPRLRRRGDGREGRIPSGPRPCQASVGSQPSRR